MTIKNKNKNRITKYLVGSDPEMFLRERDTKEIVSAIPFIPGSKYEPFQIPELKKGCMIQTDNIMVEFCIPPSNNPKEFYQDIEDCIEYANGLIPINLEATIEASVIVDDKYLQDPQAQQFSCDPDFNAWLDGDQNEGITNKTNQRVAGGHIHIGYNDPDMKTSMDIIKALDIFLGIPSILLDADKERKKMYGQAGAFRFKEYGVEYRTLSNFWTKDLDSVEMIFNGIKAAIDFVNNNGLESLSDTLKLKIQTCINTGDESLVYELIAPFKLEGLLQ